MIGAAACGPNGREPQPVSLTGIESVTYLGCVDRGDRGLVLRLVDDPAPGASAPTGQSTSVDGAWNGTRQLTLVGDAAATLRDHLGQRVRATGRLEPEAEATTGVADQIQNAEGVRFRRFTVSAFEVVPGVCALPG